MIQVDTNSKDLGTNEQINHKLLHKLKEKEKEEEEEEEEAKRVCKAEPPGPVGIKERGFVLVFVILELLFSFLFVFLYAIGKRQLWLCF